MKFSKYILTIASIATVSAIGMATPSQRVVASDKTEDQVERTQRMEELKGKITSLDTEIRDFFQRDEDSQQDKKERAARLASIKKHKQEIAVSLGRFEGEIEMKRDADLLAVREEMTKLSTRIDVGDKAEDKAEREARMTEVKSKLQLLEDTISSNAKNDALAVHMAYNDVVDRMKGGDAQADAQERAVRKAKFHEAKDKVRTFFGMRPDSK